MRRTQWKRKPPLKGQKQPLRAKLKRGSMICRIPAKMRLEMANDPYYAKCCFTGRTDNIEWHHNLIFNGKRVNEIFAILPLTEEVHRHATGFQDELNRIMLNRATDEELERYSKAIDYKKLRDRLNENFNPKR